MGGDLADVRLWAGELDVLHERFVHRFNREEPRRSALAYMRGLVAPLERKNGWTLAEEAGHAGPDRIQRLLNRIEWDADEVLDDVRDYSVAFETKVAMAKAMVRRAVADKVPFSWVTADAAYGYSKGWRFELEQADVFHVMATTRHDTVVTRWSIDHPVHDLFPGLPRQKWKRRSCGEGAHGRRIFDWARVEVRPWHREDRRHWVLARRSVSRPEDISYYIAYCPADTRLDELIRIAGSRWAVEECFQTAKQECGLDDYQVRRYPGWHRHMTLAMAAHACLTVLRARQLDTDKAETDPPSSSTSASPKSDA
jgi:SRSO17 transposase